jgi:hypothetical protein
VRELPDAAAARAAASSRPSGMDCFPNDAARSQALIVVHDYRGYGFHVKAVPAADGRWNAEVKIREQFP